MNDNQTERADSHTNESYVIAFRNLIKTLKPLKLPYKVDMSLKNDRERKNIPYTVDINFIELYSSTHPSQDDNNPFSCGCRCIIGYLPDTTNHFTLLSTTFDSEDIMGYVYSFDKKGDIIAEQKMHNHSSVEIVEDILIDENYFTVSEDLKLNYFYHFKTHYHDDIDDKNIIDYTREYKCENDGYIDSAGQIIYDVKNERELINNNGARSQTPENAEY